MTGLILAAAVLCTAGCVLVSWWIGVWGTLSMALARTTALENRVSSLESSRFRANGAAGQEVRQLKRETERERVTRVEAALLASAERAKEPAPETDGGVDRSPAALAEASRFFGARG